MNTAKEVLDLLKKSGNKKKALLSMRFFKTKKGQYGAGDTFLGLTVPECRNIAGRAKDLPLKETATLLQNPYHEARLIALFIMILQFNKGVVSQKQIITMYKTHLTFINNWDLVDASAYHLLGAWLLEKKDRSILYTLSKSKDLWKNRIAIVTTFAFIRKNDFSDTLQVSRQLLAHKHDLIHKAVGWMLREVGKRDKELLRNFLKAHRPFIHSTTLSYALEKFSFEEKQDIRNC